jgi:hypothetical protein
MISERVKPRIDFWELGTKWYPSLKINFYSNIGDHNEIMAILLSYCLKTLSFVLFDRNRMWKWLNIAVNNIIIFVWWLFPILEDDNSRSKDYWGKLPLLLTLYQLILSRMILFMYAYYNTTTFYFFKLMSLDKQIFVTSYSKCIIFYFCQTNVSLLIS